MSMHIVDEIPVKAFIKKLVDREMYQNWKIKHVPIVFKK